MRNDFCTGYLMHHGIKGQKWGKRNGPPYPLDSSQKSSSEKRSEKKGLTDKQKKYIAIGAAAAATALIAYGAYKIKAPKVATTSARLAANNMVKYITSGQKAAKPYMKLNLQYFAKGKKFKKPNYNPKQFKKSKKLRLSAKAHDTIIMSALRDHKDRFQKEQIFAYSFRDFKYYIRSNGNGTGEILTRIPIKDADTGLMERIPYVPDVKK